jgi:Fic family protein
MEIENPFGGNPLDVLEEYASSLGQLREQQQAEVEDLLRQLHSAQQNVKRIDKAINALMSEPGTPGRKPTPAKPPKSDSRVSDVNREKILSTITEHGNNGISKPEISAFTGLSTDTVRRGLNELRAAEKIRKAGTRGPGQGPTATVLFKLMESETEHVH